MFTIENDLLSVSINPKGAELDSIYHKQHQLEYLWSGDPAFWAKKSPVLFPVVGTLKQDTYYYDGRSYELGRHGFARESDFIIWRQAQHSISFSLMSNAKTLKKFPFSFQLIITYAIVENVLNVTYTVMNVSDAEMFFSIGGHPAFKVPLVNDTSYDDYYIQFDQVEDAGRWPVSVEGLIETVPLPLLQKSDRLPLTKDLFSQDAIVFKKLLSQGLTLKSDKTDHGLHFDYRGFPYLGIWAAKNADFVCIEPWCGIADSINSGQQLQEKEGIEKLDAGEQFERTWKVKLF